MIFLIGVKLERCLERPYLERLAKTFTAWDLIHSATYVWYREQNADNVNYVQISTNAKRLINIILVNAEYVNGVPNSDYIPNLVPLQCTKTMYETIEKICISTFFYIIELRSRVHDEKQETDYQRTIASALGKELLKWLARNSYLEKFKRSMQASNHSEETVASVLDFVRGFEEEVAQLIALSRSMQGQRLFFGVTHSVGHFLQG